MSDVPVGRLAGKVALVTGASRGIGVAINEHMAAEGVAVDYVANQAAANAVVARIRTALAATAVAQSSRSQQRSSLAIRRSSLRRSSVWSLRLCAILGAIFTINISAIAAEAVWKDGMMFTQEDLTSLQGHKAVKIVFGLEPGKCTGELTAVSEWLKMTQGTLVQTYPGRGDVQRVAGDEWLQENGTKVTLCNRSGANAVLIGVQFKPE